MTHLLLPSRPETRPPWSRRRGGAPLRRALLLAAAQLLALSATRPTGATEYTFSWAHPQPQGNALHGAAFEDASIGYAVGDRGVVVRTSDGGVTWALVTTFPEFSTDLEDVAVLAPGDLLAVGELPGIFRSTDAGATWVPVANPSTARLIDVEWIGAGALSAVGDNGQVLRSTDSGASWTLLPSPGGNLEEQLWPDPANGYVLGAFRVRRTTDGGQTWSPLAGLSDNAHYTEAFLVDPLHLTVLSDFLVWKSTNGGASWSGTQPPGAIVYFGNAVVLGPEHYLIVSTVEGASVYETTNAGATWAPPFSTGAGGFHDFDRLPDGTLVAVTTEGDIFRSTNDGADWANAIEASGPPRYVLGALAVGPGGTGAAGTTGTPGREWYRTTDSGAHWALDPGGPAISFTREIGWWDADHAVVAGDYGQMWRTTNGGANWIAAALPAAPANGRAWHLSLPAAGVAFANVTGQSQAFVYRTTDFGASWHQRSAGIPANMGLTSVSFPTADLGFACGYASSLARMFKTTDGGGSWSSVPTTGITN